MKKALIIIFLSITATGGVVLWMQYTDSTTSIFEYLQMGVVLLLVVFGLYFAVRHIRSARKGEPAEDELSKHLMQRAAATSFYVSLYLWLGISYVSETSSLPTHSIIGGGILAMAVTFLISWIYYKIKGVSHA